MESFLEDVSKKLYRLEFNILIQLVFNYNILIKLFA
jgi:hypothetical protein